MQFVKHIKIVQLDHVVLMFEAGNRASLDCCLSCLLTKRQEDLETTKENTLIRNWIEICLLIQIIKLSRNRNKLKVFDIKYIFRFWQA
jgi:dethiobiotin synthetase